MSVRGKFVIPGVVSSSGTPDGKESFVCSLVYNSQEYSVGYLNIIRRAPKFHISH